MNKILLLLLLVCNLQKAVTAVEYSTFEKKYKIEVKPYIVFNFKFSDCLNCSIIAVNKISTIRNKERIIVLFENKAMKYFEKKHSSKLSMCKIIYDSLYSNTLNSSPLNTINLVTDAYTKNYYINDLSDAIVDSINNILELSTNDFVTVKNDAISAKLQESLTFNNKSLFIANDVFGLWDNKMQQGIVVNDEKVSITEPVLSKQFLNEIRRRVSDKNIQLKDSLQDILLDQTGFPKFQVKELNFSDIISIGINVNTLTNKSAQIDTNLNLNLQSNLVIAIAEKIHNANILNIDSFQSFYPLNNIEVNNQKLYPTLSHGFAITSNHIFIPYNEYIILQNQNITNHFLCILNYHDSVSLLIKKIPLKYWDDNPTERIAINLDIDQNAHIGYLNNKNIYFPITNNQIILNEIEDTSQFINRGDLFDFSISGTLIKALIKNKTEIREYIIDILSKQVVKFKKIELSNIEFAKYHNNKIMVVQKNESEYKLYKYESQI